MERFLEFYKKGLSAHHKVNRDGYRMAEAYTQILLTKILTPHSTRYVDMQSPAGEAWSVLVYNYDGDVYASDESRMLAEMNDRTFRLGNVHKDTRRTLFTSEPALQMFQASAISVGRMFRLRISVLLRMPTRYTITPLRATCTETDRPAGSALRNMEVIKQLFSMIEQNDRETMRILWSWITATSVKNEVVECA